MGSCLRIRQVAIGPKSDERCFDYSHHSGCELLWLDHRALSNWFAHILSCMRNVPRVALSRVLEDKRYGPFRIRHIVQYYYVYTSYLRNTYLRALDHTQLTRVIKPVKLLYSLLKEHQKWLIIKLRSTKD
jgi:hypothetical protein